MAIGINFLSKTSSVKDIMGGAKTAGAGQKQTSVSNLSEQISGNKSSKASNPNLATMNTSDLIKYVYNNNVGNVDVKDNTQKDKDKDDKNNNIKLPLTVEYGDEKYSSHGKDLKDVIKEISMKTHDSYTKVESELKRKYSSSTGGSLNMNA